MKDVIVRWARTIGCTAFLGTMVAAGTGCGALSAAANPKVAWAVSDPAPMSVVVRRADVAEKTAKEVDRIMTDTPANDDSSWLKQVGPGKDEAAKELGDLRGTSFYQQGARIVPAEVWAKSLAQIEKKDVARAAAPAPVASAPAQSAPASATSPAPEPARESAREAEPVAPVATTQEPEPPKKGQKGQRGQKASKAQAQGQKTASAKGSKPGKGARGKKGALPAPEPLSPTPPPAPPEPVVAVASRPASAPAAPAVGTTSLTSATIPSAPAAAPASAPASSAKYSSLLAAIDKDLGAAWGQVMEKKKAMGEVKGQIAAEEAAVDAKGVSDADKKAGKKKIDALEKQLSNLEKEADKLASDFIPQAKAAAKKAPADVRERFGAVLVNLRQAVDDAGVANGAAAVRYPMAATSLPDSAKQMVAVYVADVIEERTGKRPSTSGLQPNVTLNGTDVAVTLNGLDQKDMGKLSMGELTSEVTSRTSAWVKRALGLLGTIAATKEMLAFEDDVLGALIDGFKASGWTPPAPATIPDAPAAAAAGPAAAPRS